MKEFAALIIALQCAGCIGETVSTNAEKTWHPRLALSRSIAIVATVTPAATTSLDLAKMTMEINAIRLSGTIGIEWNF